MGRVGGVGIVAALLVTTVVAQSKPTFEVASIKPQLEPMSFANIATFSPRLRPGGVFTGSHATVAALVLYAYDLQPFQLIGGPDWARRDTFEISAKASADASAAQVRRMVQSLLEDRFKLVVHTEQRDIRYYALVAARQDGRLGPYISRMPDDCTPSNAAEVVKKFPPRAATTEDGMMFGRCTNMSALASLLTVDMDKPVIDETGLSGRFVYEIRGVSLNASRLRATSDGLPKWPSVPVALEEQLGLKLQSREGPFPVLVIESVSQPTEN
jgi:uncharacterized protein (TIGR03435 family)